MTDDPNPLPWQQKVLDSQAQITVVKAGHGAGKSWVGREWIRRAAANGGKCAVVTDWDDHGLHAYRDLAKNIPIGRLGRWVPEPGSYTHIWVDGEPNEKLDGALRSSRVLITFTPPKISGDLWIEQDANVITTEYP